MKEKEEHKLNIEKYKGEYSQEKFVAKIAKFAKKAGVKVVYAAYLLYYSLFDKNFPLKDRIIIISALGYFILPFDLVPDAIPALGFADDLAALLYAVKRVAESITPETKEKAKRTVSKIFGELEEAEIDLGI